MRFFLTKLLAFFAPFAVIFGIPAFVLVVSGEGQSADEIARTHFEGRPEALYGAAYTNPDARYKLASIALHEPELVTIGSSRVLEFDASLFVGGAKRFYNAGLLVERLYEIRRALRHLDGTHPKRLIIGLDQWSFNASWPNAVDNPLYEREIGAGAGDLLNGIQRSARFVWPDLASGNLDLRRVVLEASNIGVNARMRGNGFRRDGSMVYADRLRDPNAERDYEFRDTFDRIERGNRRFEFGAELDPNALQELQLLLGEARTAGFDVIAYLPPFAPSVQKRLESKGRHAYVSKILPAVEPLFRAAGYDVFDFTSCEALGCTDGEFIDGFHAGAKTDARLLIAMANRVGWLDAIVDQEALLERIARSEAGPTLATETLR